MDDLLTAVAELRRSDAARARREVETLARVAVLADLEHAARTAFASAMQIAAEAVAALADAGEEEAAAGLAARLGGVIDTACQAVGAAVRH